MTTPPFLLQACFEGVQEWWPLLHKGCAWRHKGCAWRHKGCAWRHQGGNKGFEIGASPLLSRYIQFMIVSLLVKVMFSCDIESIAWYKHVIHLGDKSPIPPLTAYRCFLTSG